MAAPVENMSLVEGAVCVRRWLWIEDMHTRWPGYFQEVGQGDFPMFPQAQAIKKELLVMRSALGSGIDNDVGRIIVKGGFLDLDDIKNNAEPSGGHVLSDD
eukprot:6544435-Pyramimonas_sp.AAC.1